MNRFLTTLLLPLLAGSNAAAQTTPTIAYQLTVDAADLDVLNVSMQVRNAPRSFMVAAHAHPEYDDKYWRYLENMRAEQGTVTRLDSVRWQVTGAGPVVDLTYRIRLPAAPPPRAAWRAYLTSNGGLVGGPHAFLYVIGSERAAATVTLALPAGWRAATALRPTAENAFAAPDMFTLMESPIMVGRMSERTFDVARVRHRVFYLAGAQPVPFDTTAFMDGVQRLVARTIGLFGSVPYREYTFLVADDAYGGLEHPNSVTLGARSSELANDPNALMREFAHEFFHTWNLMRIKPAEYRGIDYRVQPPVPSLWFSEGYSIFYADLLQRRAGIRTEHATRIEHLQNVIMRYLNDPAYARFSAETISRVEYNSQPGALGNSDPSTHLIGEVIANALDLAIRAKTRGQRSSDDLLRGMNEQHGTVGFTGRDVERVATQVCGCDMSRFFADHVRGAQRIDFGEYLRPLGLELVTSVGPATNDRGEVERDFRIRAWQPTPADTLRLMLWNEASIWAQADLRTNDRVLSINGAGVTTWPEFRARIAAAPMGTPLNFDLVRDGRRMVKSVVMAGFPLARVTIRELSGATAQQVKLRQEWLSGR